MVIEEEAPEERAARRDRRLHVRVDVDQAGVVGVISGISHVGPLGPGGPWSSLHGSSRTSGFPRRVPQPSPTPPDQGLVKALG
jgi:hypothetical protein